MKPDSSQNDKHEKPDEQQEAVPELVMLMKTASDRFDQLCQERHVAGAAEYGAFTFLENDVVNMMLEELADTANYCRYQFIKLMILQDLIAQDLQDKGQEVQDLGIGSFKGVGDVGWSH